MPVSSPYVPKKIFIYNFFAKLLSKLLLTGNKSEEFLQNKPTQQLNQQR